MPQSLILVLEAPATCGLVHSRRRRVDTSCTCVCVCVCVFVAVCAAVPAAVFACRAAVCLLLVCVD